MGVGKNAFSSKKNAVLRDVVSRKHYSFYTFFQMCLHPEVSAYITDIIKSLAMLLKAGRVDYIAVVILPEGDGTPLEKFVFELGKLKNNWKE